MADGFHGFAFGEAVAAAAVRAHAGEQVGGDGDIACGGELVSEILDPIGHAKDFVDDKHDRRFAFGFGINHEGLDGAVAVLYGDPFAVARGLFERGLGPVLRGGEGRGT